MMKLENIKLLFLDVTLHLPPKWYGRFLHTSNCATRSLPFLFFYLAKYKNASKLAF
jgi:hypothetical protein